MSKQISATELAEVVTRLLSKPEDFLDSYETYQGFMTSIAEVVCDYCGGEIHFPAEKSEEEWLVGIFKNDSLPDTSESIWDNYDPEGSFNK